MFLFFLVIIYVLVLKYVNEFWILLKSSHSNVSWNFLLFVRLVIF